jgi:C1A family cysteine protease
MDTHLELGLGWLPDLADLRDYTHDADAIQRTLSKAKSIAAGKPKPGLPASVDLRPWCSPIENQGNLGSCTAHAGVGLVEYFERRAFNTYLDASRRFLYKVTRNLLHWQGDTGAFLRSTMKSMVLFGVPPEEYWRYDIAHFDDEPPAFCYAFAQNYQTIQYYRLDPPGTTKSDLLNRVRQLLAAGLPAMFGFTVYSSISTVGSDGNIPYPSAGEKVVGGHAIDVVGYDDGRTIGKQKGAFLIRNSWGTAWGDQGYGWLPYAYLESGLATDWWSLLKAEWIDTGKFS